MSTTTASKFLRSVTFAATALAFSAGCGLRQRCGNGQYQRL